ncbi:hypothetical protein M0802_008317 [Mischocyttarus mexicanus]|nr:hypothetical protein M0802_008317 [Mischocyttarus mexicanus]
MKFDIKSTTSYNSIHPTYHYNEQFANNVETYQEGTKWLGIFLAFISGAFFTISSALVKAVRNVDPMILLMIRAILQILVMVIIAIRTTKNIFGPKNQQMLIHLQGFVGGMTVSLLFYSFRKLPLGDATTIIFSSPIIVIILSFVFLKEPCGLLRIIVAAILFTGVILVARPPLLFQIRKAESYDIVGYVYALTAALFTALNIVIIRKCQEIHYSIIVLNLSIWSLVTATFFFFVIPGNNEHKLILPNDWLTWGKIISLSLTGLGGQVLVANALKIEGAGKVSITRSLDIILAYIVQIYIFEDEPSSTSIIGAILIIFSVISMGFEKEIYGICDFIP